MPDSIQLPVRLINFLPRACKFVLPIYSAECTILNWRTLNFRVACAIFGRKKFSRIKTNSENRKCNHRWMKNRWNCQEALGCNFWTCTCIWSYQTKGRNCSADVCFICNMYLVWVSFFCCIYLIFMVIISGVEVYHTGIRFLHGMRFSFQIMRRDTSRWFPLLLRWKGALIQLWYINIH